MSRVVVVVVVSSVLTLACVRSSGPSSQTRGPSVQVEPDVGTPVTRREDAPILFLSTDGYYGYENEDYEVVIMARYSMAKPFVDQVAPVAGTDGWIFINRVGERIATAFVFDNFADEFAQDRARIVDGEGPDAKYGFLHSNGTIVVPPTWSFALPFSDGYAAVCEGCVREDFDEHFTMKGGKWGFIGLDGSVRIAPRFSAAESFFGGRAQVTEAGQSFVIGLDGKPVSE